MRGEGGRNPKETMTQVPYFLYGPLLENMKKKEKQDVSKNVKLARGTKLKSQKAIGTEAKELGSEEKKVH